jgi:hypothetical protein
MTTRVKEMIHEAGSMSASRTRTQRIWTSVPVYAKLAWSASGDYVGPRVDRTKPTEEVLSSG